MQIWTNKCDRRYDSLWAALIQKEFHQLPSNIRFLSWNYDFQMEISYKEYLPSTVKYLSNTRGYLNVITNNFDRNELVSKDRFAIYKLNGNANIYSDYSQPPFNQLEESYFFESFEDGWTEKSINSIIEAYTKLKTGVRLRPTLSFAWEHVFESTSLETSFIRVIEDDISDAEILVIIGYSFPYFNRTVDRELFRSMKSLRKIYIQDINPSNVKSSLKSIIPNLTNLLEIQNLEIEEISDCERQFFYLMNCNKYGIKVLYNFITR